MQKDKNFEKILSILFGIEGGYSNDNDDRGGATNYGITQSTYDTWREMNKLPKGSVKDNLTKEEAKQIYYNMYWKKSGADLYEDPRDAMILFDTAVNSGPENAKKLFKQSGDNFYTMLNNRKKYYDEITSHDAKQFKFYDGWMNRLKTIEDNANNMIKEGFYTPPYYNEITPFDKGYEGNLNPVGDIPDRDAKRNKYQYIHNKAIQNNMINSNESEQNFKLKRQFEDMAPWEIKKFIRKYI